MSWEDTIKKSSDKDMMDRIIRYFQAELDVPPPISEHEVDNRISAMNTQAIKEMLEGAKEIKEKLQ